MYQNTMPIRSYEDPRAQGENYLPAYAHGGYVQHDPEEDSYDYHQDMDYDHYSEDHSDIEYPHYYNDLIREHFARGGSVSNLPAYLRAAATRAHTAVQPVLNKIASGARYAGSQAYRLGQNALNAARYAGRQAYGAGQRGYNYMRGRPMQNTPAAAANAPRSFEDRLAPYGRAAASGIASYVAPTVGRVAGTLLGAPVAQLGAGSMFPYIPRALRDPLAGFAGGMMGAPIGGAAASYFGPRIAAPIGERSARLLGRGLDYVTGRAAPAVAAAQNLASTQIAPYARRIGDIASSGASALGSAASSALDRAHSYTPAGMRARAGEAFSAGLPGVAEMRAQQPAPQGWGSYFGNALSSGLSTLGSYTPASMMTSYMTRHPETIPSGRANLAGMPGFEAEMQPLLGSPRSTGSSSSGYSPFSRGRSDSSESFVTARSGSPLFDLDVD